MSPNSKILLEKPNRSSAVKKFPELYRTQRFIHKCVHKSWTPCPYPQPDYSSPYPKLQIKIHFNINLLHMPRSSRRSNQNLAHISSPPNICYMPYISHPLQADHKDTIL